METSDNKSKNWLSRLKYLKIRRQSSSCSRINCISQRESNIFSGINEENLQRNLSVGDNGNLSAGNTLHIQRRNSFRKSLTKMQKRVRNVFRHGNNSNFRNSSDFSVTPPHTNSRVTLNTPISHVENEYTLEPADSLSLFLDNRAHVPPGLNLASTEQVGSSSTTTTPVISPRSRNFPQLCLNYGCIPKNEVAILSKYYWYWGPISKGQAEERLKNLPDGAFLVRDSCSERYIFTVSFCNMGKILHTRIELSKSGYSLFDQTGYSSIAELVEDAVAKSKHSVYCYTKPKDDMHPHCPVRLTLPVSRYEKVPTLKCLSRLVIKQYVINDDMHKLPLPVSLIEYLKERHYL